MALFSKQHSEANWLVSRAELLRLDANARMVDANRLELGQFFTPASVATFMASMFGRIGSHVNVLDPGAGTGALTAAFTAEMCRRPDHPESISVHAYELDTKLSTSLSSTLRACKDLCHTLGINFSFKIHTDDFIKKAVNDILWRREQVFSHVILNPPYKKLSSVSSHRKLLRRVGIETSNLYSAFVALSVALLQPDGEMVAITPRSFCNGLYFKSFRKYFLSQMRFKRIHVFAHRDKAFKDSDVLQENVIFHAIRTTQQGASVLVTSSSGPDDDYSLVREVPFEQLVVPGDEELFIRIQTDETDRLAANRMLSLKASLKDLGLKVSTGKVVDFRQRSYLCHEPSLGTVPLIYPGNMKQGEVTWPLLPNRKPQAFYREAGSEEFLCPPGIYVLVKRFSAKEERRRIVAAVWDSSRFENTAVAFENHVNYFHQDDHGIPPTVAYGLMAFLNSSLVDCYFRQLSGHTQVNATDLRNMRYPTLDELDEIGKRVQRFRGEFYNQEVIDQVVEQSLFGGSDNSGLDPSTLNVKVQEALELLKELGLPRGQQNERSALTLLALLDLRPGSPWAEASSPQRGITELMDFFAKEYGKQYAPNTRETVRRFTMHQFVDAGIAIRNPDNPTRPVNSPQTVYQIEPQALDVIRSYKSDQWQEKLSAYLASVNTLKSRYAKERAMRKIPLRIAHDTEINLSPGKHSELIKQVVDQFCPSFTPNARLIYVGDTEDKFAYFDRDALLELGVVVEEHGKMPDVLVLDENNQWLVLIEVVTSHGPVGPKRHGELKELFAKCSVGLVFVTAFPDVKTMSRYIGDIAWETEVWLAEAPSHMIHFNGERFLGPYDG